MISLLKQTVVSSSTNKGCITRDYGKGSIVCVCNSSYCDSFEPIESKGGKDKIHVIESNKIGLRFKHSIIPPDSRDDKNKKVIDIILDSKELYQEIKGFGAAFTDAAAETSMSLGQVTAENIVRQFYSPAGLSYSLGRLVIGGSDFSSRKYTYNDREGIKDKADQEDFNLDHFALQEEDTKFKVNIMAREEERLK